MTKERFTGLLDGFLQQTLTQDEIEEFLQEAGKPGHQQVLAGILDKHFEDRRFTGLAGEDQASAAFRTLADKIGIVPVENETPKVRRMPLYRRWAAAAVLVLIAGGAYLYFNRSVQAPDAVVNDRSVYSSDAVPGSNKATLTLANGKTIQLDTTHNGLLAEQGATKVLQKGNGQLDYQAKKGMTAGGEIAYNILSTPKGGQYQLNLPDGSRVWLNAASSIRYPTVFSGAERIVEVSGEAYFEVTADAAMPFRVKGRGVMVEVLGTKFNINTYEDEPVSRTTLAEGKVKVTGGSSSQVLSPGEQALVDPAGTIRLEQNADLEKTMAWKNNQFIFERDDLPAILRQLGRWYDVEILYQGSSPKPYHFSGIISRARNASDVLHMLEATGNIHFDIEGKKIIVKP